MDGLRFFFTSDVKSILGSIQMEGMIGTGRCRQSRQACFVSAVRLRESQETPDDHRYDQESVPHKREKAALDAICIIHLLKKRAQLMELKFISN